MNLIATSTVLDDTWLNQPPVATLIELQYDPIACACASYRAWIQNGIKFADLDTIVPSKEDHDRAQQIRNYYRAKITWQMLQNQTHRPVSEFRRKLMGIIEGTQRITTAELGILHRINYFYDEDQAHDSIFEEFRAGREPVGILPTVKTSHRERVSLTRTVVVSRKNYENIEFWMEPAHTPVPCMIPVSNQNPLLSLIDSVLAAGPVELLANWYPKVMPGPGDRAYYRLSHLKLA